MKRHQPVSHVVPLVFLLSLIPGGGLCGQPGPDPCQLITTRFAGLVNPDTPGSAIDPNGFVVERTDVSSPPSLPGLWAPPITADPSWTASNLGQVFGLALDDSVPANIYVAATTAYGNFSGDPSQFGPGGPGAIYRLDGTTGAITVFATLPNSGPALGNICFAPGRGPSGNGALYVANLDDGQIYALDIPVPGLPGVIFDQAAVWAGVGPHALGSFAPLGERPYAVQIDPYDDRLYYSVWQGNLGTGMASWHPGALGLGATPGAEHNTVCSIALDSTGFFAAPPARRIERYLPYYAGNNYSNPVTDIAFTTCRVEMFSTAERTFMGDYGTLGLAHEARIQQFIIGYTIWFASPHSFHVGAPVSTVPPPPPTNAAGGLDIDTADNIYATGDALGVAQYGVQRIPAGGNTPTTATSSSLTISYPDAVKAGMGDVEFLRPLHCDCDTGAPCEVGDLDLILNTGWDDGTSTVTPFGQPDDDWLVVRDSDLTDSATQAPWVTTLEPSTPTARAVQPGWAPAQTLGSGPGSRWIYSGTDHNATYVWYQYCFCLSAGFAQPRLDIDVLGDDEALVYLNGKLLGSTGTPGFQAATQFVTTDPQDFVPGQNCLEIRVRNDIVVAGLNVIGTLTAQGGKCCCVPPPAGLIDWWPLDGLGARAVDLVGTNHGYYVNPDLQPGVVGNADYFGNGGAVQVIWPTPSLANLHRFSIDAWLKIDCETACPLAYDQPILSKRNSTSNRGLDFFVQGNPGLLPGGLGVMLYGNGMTLNALQTGGVNLLDSEWHLVAATHDGNDNVELWIDGVRVPTSVTGTTPSTFATGTAPLWIGASNASGSTVSFQGWLDEVEVFDRALTGREIRSIAEAPLGKCREACLVPSVKSVVGGNVVTIPVTICNGGAVAQNYTIQYIPGSGCAAPAATAVTPFPLTVNVSPGCTTTLVQLQAPAVNGLSCYTMCVTNADTGKTFCCPGTLELQGVVEIGDDVDPVIFDPRFPRTIQFPLTNLTIQDLSMPYRIVPRPLPRGGQVLPSLDGLPPGEPVRRDVGLPPEGLASISVTVTYDEHSANPFDELVLELDLDGTGTMVPVASVILQVGVPAYRLRAEHLDVSSADFTGVNIHVAASDPIDAFDVALAYDGSILTIDEVDFTGTIVELEGLDFLATEFFAGGVTFAGVMSGAIPAGFEEVLAVLRGQAQSVGIPTLTPLQFVDDVLGAPPVVNTLSVGGTIVVEDNGLTLEDGSVLLQPGEVTFIRSDCNSDGGSDIGDAIFVLAYTFSGGMSPACDDACDMNDDGAIDIGDAVHQLAFQFTSGPAPTAPFPDCGVDPSPDAQGCAQNPACP